jgi:Flp pilus assembly protein TadG
MRLNGSLTLSALDRSLVPFTGFGARQQMIKFFRRLWKDRRGNALLIAGAALPLLVGSAGLATDTIQWVLWKRELQRLADSAALAGVYAKVSGTTVGTCSNVSSPTYADPVAYDVKTNNVISADSNLTCSVNNPPTAGSYTGDTNAVRVSLSMQRNLSFSGMFMSSAPTITADATATIVPAGDYCVVSLEANSVTGIDATGSTNVNLGCGMITNSTSLSAAVATGSSSVTASPIAAVGGIPSSTHWGTGTVLQPFTIAQADPFASVSPTAPSSCTGGAITVQPSDNLTDTTGATATTADDALSPGCYASMDLKGTVTLKPGTYYIDAGDFTVNSGAVVNCSGCVIVMSNKNSTSNTIGDVDLNGNATINMTAPDSGTFKGILFYQDRRAASDNDIKINGNSSSKFQGAFYFPKADLTFNGTAGMITNCMQIVAKDVTFTGNSAINNTCPAGSGSGSFSGQRVRLVE